ncbi:MAG: 2-oxoacid:acceptor oxidoreductase family protein, partial [Alistipes sp.]|nr:2-oxoacid:acceptor oxidoreductase family protein [Alistipes sp.]
MKETIIIAGFGGQGVLSMGKILAYSGVMQDLEVTWMPSYGPEMRGGTANVTVIISDKRISSPVADSYDTAIILNQQSMDKFESKVKPGGVLIYDTNGIIAPPTRTDIEIYSIDEAFLDLRGMNDIDFDAYAKKISATCWKMTSIPVSVGIAPTKTLAKIASKLCKKYPRLRGGCYMH